MSVPEPVEGMVFMHTDAVPVTIPTLNGPDRAGWAGRLWPETEGTWQWTCPHVHWFPRPARRCALRVLRLLERAAGGEVWAEQMILSSGGWAEDRPQA